MRVRNVAKDALDTAMAFHEGAIRWATEDPLSGGGCCCPTAPTVANGAFAIELYFKGLALRRGVSTRGHDLAVLFRDALEDDERQALGYRWKEGRFPSSYEDMLQALEHLADAFRRHRYQYEQDHLSISMGSLCRLLRACYVGVRDIAPEWPDVPRSVWRRYDRGRQCCRWRYMGSK